MIIGIFMGLLTILLILIKYYYKFSFDYWKRRQVPYLKPSIPFGNVGNPFFAKTGHNELCKYFYEHFKKDNCKFGGIYLSSTPVLIPVDPELIKHIMVKDFNHFTSHGIHIDKKVDPIFYHLFAMNEPDWKPMRIRVRPGFTPLKMKMMFETFLDVGESLKQNVEESLRKDVYVDIREITCCFITDVTASCFFGVKCNSRYKDDNEFCRIRKLSITSSPLFILRRLFLNKIPVLKIPIFANELTIFYKNLLKSIIHHREVSHRRADFVQILVDANKDEKNPVSIDELIGIIFGFFNAGFETISNTMAFCLHELSYNQMLQDQARTEVENVLKKHNGNITIESINEMQFLSQVLDETLRKYTPLNVIPRECTADYKIPGSTTVIEKGTHVWISAVGIHKDPEIYPDPEKFDPERFNEENKNMRHPFTFIPFGKGPRNCIAFKFSLLQMKTALTILLSNYKFFPIENSKYKLNFLQHTVFMKSKEDILLKVKSLK